MNFKYYIPLLVGIFLVESAWSIPTFARKFRTSCVTCHSPYPKLNEFGESFRMNGYRIPGDDDESTATEPVKLGSDAYKRVFPDALWPNDIPESTPLSFRAKTGLSYRRSSESSATDAQSDFLPPTLQMIAAGTLGDDISFMAGAHLYESGQPGSLDRLYLKFNRPLGEMLPDRTLYLRFGQFIPEVVPFASNHRSATISPYAFNTYYPGMGDNFSAGHGHGSPGLTLEAFQVGAEASGFFGNRFRYVAGVINGNGPNVVDNNGAKDLYGRMAVKFGRGWFADRDEGSPAPYSLALGVFAFNSTRLNEGYKSPANLEAFRGGSDVQGNWKTLDFNGGWIWGRDKSVAGKAVIDADYQLFFGEMSWAVYPWLVPILRYEQVSSDLANPKQLVGSLNVLARANTKLVFELPYDVDAKDWKVFSTQLETAF